MPSIKAKKKCSLNRYAKDVVLKVTGAADSSSFVGFLFGTYQFNEVWQLFVVCSLHCLVSRVSESESKQGKTTSHIDWSSQKANGNSYLTCIHAGANCKFNDWRSWNEILIFVFIVRLLPFLHSLYFISNRFWVWYDTENKHTYTHVFLVRL